MDFRTRKISYKREKPSFFKTHILPFIVSHKSKLAIIGAALIIVILFFYGCAALVQRIGLINIIGIFGEPLTQDQYGTTNILMLGTGNPEHDGADLTDTIILASIDQKNKLVPMLSIPRDYYVDVPDLGGGMKINGVYEAGKYKFNSLKGIEYLLTEIENLTGMKIHYFVRIDFNGFKDIVDALGGVDIYVDEAIHDPYYPLDGTILYETFNLAAGQQTLDGDTALKYARSRKTTSDFDRSKRQQKLLFAIKNKAMTKSILLDPGKITNLYNAVSAHIETNLSIRQIIELAKISQDFGEENIITRVITDDPIHCGGFLYTPERALFGGAAVLTPIGNKSNFIKQYSDLIFHYPDIIKNPVKIQMLNGTKTAGLAADGKALLQRLCFEIPRFANAETQNVSQTTIYFRNKENPPAALKFIQQVIPGIVTSDIPALYNDPTWQSYAPEADIIIELGQDFAESKPNDIFYLYYPVDNPVTTTTINEETSTESASAAGTGEAQPKVPAAEPAPEAAE